MSATPTLDELGTPALDLTLAAGDCLYLPRGFPHAAETVERASSHLTIGVLALAWHQAVRHAVDEAVGAGALRASIPPAPDERPGPRRGRRPPRPADTAALDDQGGVAAAAGDAVASAAPAGGRRSRRVSTSRRARCCGWRQRATGSTLGLGDRVLTMPAEAQPLLAAVLGSAGPFTLADLDGTLDD